MGSARSGRAAGQLGRRPAQTDRPDDALTRSTLPIIWDRRNQSGGPRGRYHYRDVPFMALRGGIGGRSSAGRHPRRRRNFDEWGGFSSTVSSSWTSLANS